MHTSLGKAEKYRYFCVNHNNIESISIRTIVTNAMIILYSPRQWHGERYFMTPKLYDENCILFWGR